MINNLNSTEGLKEDIAPVLQIIFNSSLNTGFFPSTFLKNTNLFLYKGGDNKDPAQYRSIVVQNPVLKVFCKILQARLAPRMENIQLVPSYMWYNQTSFGPPNNKEYRKKIA